VFTDFRKLEKRAEYDLPETGGLAGRRELAQTMYTHASKCKNDKIKRERKKERNDGKNFPIK
jgi:hypothetical protein